MLTLESLLTVSPLIGGAVVKEEEIGFIAVNNRAFATFCLSWKWPCFCCIDLRVNDRSIYSAIAQTSKWLLNRQ